MSLITRRIGISLSASVKNLCRISKMEGLFKQHGVVPDVLDAAPKACAAISFNNKAVNTGEVLTPTHVKNVPKVEWEAEKGAFYTIIENDPDAPSRADPKWGEWHHWLVVNIPENKVSEGQTMSEYIGAGPPKDTGLHRYVYLVFKQQGKQEFPGLTKLTNRSGDHRPQWKVREFAKKYNLDLVAGNFYQAEFDDYVPKLYEQLSGK